MKKVHLLIVFTFAIFTTKAQGFYQNLGINYSQTSGSYGNFDVMSLQYAPQYHVNKGRMIYGISMPLTMGFLMSAARTESRDIMYELPVNFEIGYNPNAPCVNYKKFSAFGGLGYSKQKQLINTAFQNDFINATLGVRFAPFNIPVEVRLIGSKSMMSANETYRLGCSFSLSLN